MLAACDADEPSGSKGNDVDKQARSSASADDEDARSRAPVRAVDPSKAGRRRGPIINEAPKPSTPKDPQEARFQPIDGDPPFIDGYNPEEAPCPSGNWCGTIETAMAVAPNPDAIAKEMGCPTRIVGSHNPSPIKGAAYQGLSDKTAMQGTLNQHGTELARADDRDDACCYHWFEYCSGRPLLDDGTPRVAASREDASWIGEERRGKPLDPTVAETLAEQWLQDALAEHASVASFARVTLELLALGAPPDLVQQAQQAGLDEIDHARRCFALASRYAGRPLGPGALAPPPPRPADLTRMAVDTFIEGCIGETIAALIAERSIAGCTDPDVVETLKVIADDEARHAALAWRTIAWAIEQGGDDVREALSAAVAAHRPQVGEVPTTEQDAALRAHGRLGPAARSTAARDAYRDIIDPMVRSLLA